MAKRKRNKRPVIKITADHIDIACLACDMLIVLILIVWFAVEHI